MLPFASRDEENELTTRSVTDELGGTVAVGGSTVLATAMTVSGVMGVSLSSTLPLTSRTPSGDEIGDSKTSHPNGPPHASPAVENQHTHVE